MARYIRQLELEDLAKLEPKIKRARIAQEKIEKNGRWVKVDHKTYKLVKK